LRGSLNVRFAPKATELLRRRETTRWARSRHLPILEVRPPQFGESAVV
jgi:hypothetical protein